MSQKRFYLNCPYSEKDLCKTLGAKWDKDKKKWYVPDGLERSKFRRWWAENSINKTSLKVIK